MKELLPEYYVLLLIVFYSNKNRKEPKATLIND